MSKEWSENKKWNPFNSYKLLAQVYRWRKIKRGAKIPPPSLITIDPINMCNLECEYCNAGYILENNREMLSERILLDLPYFLSSWVNPYTSDAGIESICVAGGGEPLLNKYVGEFIDNCVDKGIEVGVVTNGILIDRFLESLSKCTWVGVSVDAGSKETFIKLKKKDMFDKVITNIKLLNDYSRKNNTRLFNKSQGYGVSYKYLLHPYNILEVKLAAGIAKESGCKNFHLRPVGVPWNKVGENNISFNFDDIQSFNAQIEDARKLEDDNFGVFGITHKFDNKLQKSNHFNKCHAIFMTFVITPGSEKDKFNIETCCDRRGDKDMILGENLRSVGEIGDLWGSDKHWDIHDNIKVSTCPRCTYSPHCQIYEYVIEQDNMTYKFI